MMVIDPSKRFFSAAFVLAGIAVITVNAWLLADFFGRPLTKRSESLKRVSIKWEQFTVLTAALAADPAKSAMAETILARPEPARPPQSPPAEPPIAPPADRPPVLTGIFQVLEVDRNFEAIAILDGKRLKKHNSVKGFTIEKITAEGVVLKKNGQTHFIPAPHVFFSLERKEGGAASQAR